MSTTPAVTQGADAPPEGRRARRLGWAWFAGADEHVLSLVPSERSFLDSQGLVIVAMACVTGFAVAVAGSGWWNVPITHVLWLGVVWAAVICIVDRLIYKSFGTSRRTNLLLALPRAALSLMLALVLGLPMVQFIFKPSISNQLSQTSALEQKDAQKAAISFYEPKIKQANRADRRDPGHETSIENRITKFTRLSGCETTSRRARPRTVPAADTGAATTRSRQASPAPRSRDRPADRARVAGLRAKIGGWQRAEAVETRTPRRRHRARHGSARASTCALDDRETAS